MNINLHIDRIMLDEIGATSIHNNNLVVSIKNELAKLLNNNDRSYNNKEINLSKNIENNHQTTKNITKDIGIKIAQSVHSNINRS